MKLRTYIFPITISVCIIIFAFSLPRIVAYVQEGIIENQVDTHNIQGVTLATSDSEENTLALLESAALGKQMTQIGGIPVEPDEAEDIYRTVIKELGLLKGYGIDCIQPEQYFEYEANPFFITNDNMRDVRMLWNCYLYTKDTSTVLELIIDDTNRQILSFTIHFDNEDNNQIPPDLWAAALAEYYGFANGNVSKDGKLKFIDTSGNTLELLYLWGDSFFTFNYHDEDYHTSEGLSE